MSYDIYLGVRVADVTKEDGEPLTVIVGEPELSSPTYNLGEMFRACMDWDFDTDVWYRVSDIWPNLLHGIDELRFHRDKYLKYEPKNGWGDAAGALRVLESLRDEINERCESGWSTTIPMEHLWVRW